MVLNNTSETIILLQSFWMMKLNIHFILGSLIVNASIHTVTLLNRLLSWTTSKLTIKLVNNIILFCPGNRRRQHRQSQNSEIHPEVARPNIFVYICL